MDNKTFFGQPVKNKHGGREKFIKISRNNSYTTENLLDYLYDQKYYKLIGIDLSGQINTIMPQETDIVGKLEENDGATVCSIAEVQQTTILNFSLDLLTVTE